MTDLGFGQKISFSCFLMLYQINNKQTNCTIRRYKNARWLIDTYKLTLINDYVYDFGKGLPNLTKAISMLHSCTDHILLTKHYKSTPLEKYPLVFNMPMSCLCHKDLKRIIKSRYHTNFGHKKVNATIPRAVYKEKGIGLPTGKGLS